MTPLVVPNAGEQIALEALVNKTAPQNLRYRLYTNNITPAETDVAGTYTEATFTGYAGQTLTGANWTVTPGAPTLAGHAQLTFASTANQTLQNVYGYYVTQVTSGTIVLAERFTGAPFAIQNSGDEIRLTPSISAD
jgi:hypothetical protein